MLERRENDNRPLDSPRRQLYLLDYKDGLDKLIE